MNDEWRPFGIADEEVEQFEVLHDGVPDWLLERLIDWLSIALIHDGAEVHYRVLEIQGATRVELGVTASNARRGRHLQDSIRQLSELHILRVVDYVLSQERKWFLDNYELPRHLEAILGQGSSKWTVGARLQHSGLVARVPEGVQIGAEDAIRRSETAGQVLKRAWVHLFGVEPNSSAAYADCVRATEIAVISRVEPLNVRATLGTSIGQMTTDSDWRLPLREGKSDSRDLVLAMLSTIWSGHRDRHGGVDYSDVTVEESRVGLMLAVPLVDWFESGSVARRASGSPQPGA